MPPKNKSSPRQTRKTSRAKRESESSTDTESNGKDFESPKKVKSQQSKKKPKPNGSNKKKIIVYVLEHGKHIKFDRPEIAEAYKHENSDSIVDTIEFPTTTSYLEYKKQTGTDMPTPVRQVKKEKLTPEEERALARITKYREEHAPTKTINVIWKTTSFSRAVLVFIEIRDQNGKHYWCFKARDFVETMKAFAADKTTKLNGLHTKQLIENLHFAERRNPDKGENSADTVKGYTNYQAYTHFVLRELNNAGITNSEQETEHITNILKYFGSELKRIMSSNLYIASLRDCVSKYSKLLDSKMFEPQKGVDYQTFMQQCTVLVKPMVNLTDHVIRDRLNVLRGILALHDTPEPKYGLIPDEDLPPEEATGAKDDEYLTPQEDDESEEEEETATTNQLDNCNQCNEETDTTNKGSYANDFVPGEQS
jgi:hypothetical protein